MLPEAAPRRWPASPSGQEQRVPAPLPHSNEARRCLVADTVDGLPSVFLAALYQAERSIAAHIHRLKVGTPPWDTVDADKAIPRVAQKL